MFIVIRGIELIEYIGIMFLDRIKNMKHQVVFIEIEVLDNMKPQIVNLLTSISLFLLGSIGHWYIMYWQFKMTNWVKTPWPYLISVGCTFLWITASHYGVKAFNGEMWSNRFIFFVTGIIIAAVLYPYHFGQPFTMKTATQLLLAFTIIIISLFWK